MKRTRRTFFRNCGAIVVVSAAMMQCVSSQSIWPQAWSSGAANRGGRRGRGHATRRMRDLRRRKGGQKYVLCGLQGALPMCHRCSGRGKAAPRWPNAGDTAESRSRRCQRPCVSPAARHARGGSALLKLSWTRRSSLCVTAEPPSRLVLELTVTSSVVLRSRSGCES